jgi:hypothetical protein
MLPESNYFQVTVAEREARLKAELEIEARGGEEVRGKGVKAFAREAGRAIRKNWVLLIYMYVFPSHFPSISIGYH